jgi:hypothetical protein
MSRMSEADILDEMLTEISNEEMMKELLRE